MEAPTIPFAVQVPRLDMEEKEYNIDGEKVTSRKLDIVVMGGTHTVKFDREQYQSYRHLHGAPAVIRGVIGFTRKGVPELKLTEIAEGKKAA